MWCAASCADREFAERAAQSGKNYLQQWPVGRHGVHYPPEVSMLKQLNEYKARLDAFRPLGPELLPEIKAYYRVALTYTSTALEGFTYTKAKPRCCWKKG